MMFEPVLPWAVVIVLAGLSLAYLILCMINKNYRKPKNFRRIAILMLMTLIIARPTFPGKVVESEISNISAYFVVDLTNSMGVEDVNGKSRIEQVKADMLEIIDSINISRIAVIVQDSRTYTLIPNSSDVASAKEAIANISLKSSDSSNGTNLVELLQTASNSSENYMKRFPNRESVVFIFSDGENALNYSGNNETSELPNMLFPKASAGVVLGYGSVEGGPVPIVKGIGAEESESTDSSDESVNNSPETLDGVVSKIDENYLKQIADKYTFSYIHRTDGSEFAKSLKLQLSEKVDFDNSSQIMSRIDVYWVFAIIAVILLFWNFYGALNMVLAEREKKS